MSAPATSRPRRISPAVPAVVQRPWELLHGYFHRDSNQPLMGLWRRLNQQHSRPDSSGSSVRCGTYRVKLTATGPIGSNSGNEQLHQRDQCSRPAFSDSSDQILERCSLAIQHAGFPSHKPGSFSLTGAVAVPNGSPFRLASASSFTLAGGQTNSVLVASAHPVQHLHNKRCLHQQRRQQHQCSQRHGCPCLAPGHYSHSESPAQM